MSLRIIDFCVDEIFLDVGRIYGMTVSCDNVDYLAPHTKMSECSITSNAYDFQYRYCCYSLLSLHDENFPFCLHVSMVMTNALLPVFGIISSYSISGYVNC